MSVSGKYMTCSINGLEIFDNYSWSMDEGGDALDRTTGAWNGWEAEDMGVQNGHVSIKGYMDVSTGQYLPIRRGQIITNLLLFPDENSIVPSFTIPEALIVRSTQGGEIRGKIEWSCEVHSRGEVIATDPS